MILENESYPKNSVPWRQSSPNLFKIGTDALSQINLTRRQKSIISLLVVRRHAPVTQTQNSRLEKKGDVSYVDGS